MRPLILAVVAATCLIVAPSAEARRGSCANGACAVNKTVTVEESAAGKAVTVEKKVEQKFDPSKHPRDEKTGKFVKVEKKVEVSAERRAPARRAARAAARVGHAAARVLTAPFRFLLHRGC